MFCGTFSSPLCSLFSSQRSTRSERGSVGLEYLVGGKKLLSFFPQHACDRPGSREAVLPEAVSSQRGHIRGNSRRAPSTHRPRSSDLLDRLSRQLMSQYQQRKGYTPSVLYSWETWKDLKGRTATYFHPPSPPPFLNLVLGEVWTILGKAPARCQKASPRLSLEGSSWELAGKGRASALLVVSPRFKVTW